MSIRARAAASAALALLACEAGAVAATPPLPKTTSPDLWATIDVCDTAAHPDTVGVRGSMPGTGDRRERMYMEFVIEYFDARSHWHYLRGGQSAFVALGDASARSRQGGQNFTVAPSSGKRSVLRGVVVFEWRSGSRTIATTVRSTTAGHTASTGADPRGYSASLCTIPANRRGSLVITPVTPSAASRRISAASSTVHG